MTAESSWEVWGLEASIVVTDPAGLAAAESIVRGVIGAVDAACSRFRQDSELVRIQPLLATGARVGPLLAMLLRQALLAARLTDGAVDPTLGRDLERLGYDSDISMVQLYPRQTVGGLVPTSHRTPGWQRVMLSGLSLTVPGDLKLDLGASAKAVAADLAATQAAVRTGVGVLVCLGGDIATSGEGPDGGWQVLVQDRPQDPAQQVTLLSGMAMATSSTQKRRWQHAGREVHHILDPRFGLPAEAIWRSVTVAAPTCLEANAYSTAGIVRGLAAPGWFDHHGVAGRFVDPEGASLTTGAWPRERQMDPGALQHG